MKVRFFLRNISRHTKFVPIQCRISHRGTKEFNIDLAIRPCNWDQEKQCDKTGKLDKYLKLIEDKIMDIYNEEHPANAKEIHAILKSQHERPRNEFQSIVDQFIEHKKLMNVHKYTISRYKRAFKYFRKVCDLPLIKIKKHHTMSYYNFLRGSMQNNMAIKYIDTMKAIVEFAIDKEFIAIKNPFAGHGLKIEDKEIVYLTKDELDRLMNKDFSHNSRLGVVRDVFVFQCFTGLEYQRVAMLTMDMLFHNHDGHLRLRTTRQKTKVSSSVRVWPEALELIEKYNDDECRLTGKVFPVKSNQKMNEYLKEIATLCNIEKHLTIHKARHTFATTICLDRGASMEYTSRQLGHKSIKTTQRRYAVISDRRIQNEDDMIEKRYYGNSEDIQSDE